MYLDTKIIKTQKEYRYIITRAFALN